MMTAISGLVEALPARWTEQPVDELKIEAINRVAHQLLFGAALSYLERINVTIERSKNIDASPFKRGRERPASYP
ncbi:MAG: hypothetical protein ABW047_17165 [Nitrospiraceae bacterium]|jgi:hypothetical protein